ncbi:hypothetical protein ED733_007774 [Metarhizium rileyi]|uniref:Carbohydrate-binding module family 19 protein n=1 Tax=Metarhizium rileyi (strain RCEF 4871) TaxID=1649241 RepID=A0A5C6GKP8_METRR|nr:hypothetical protein ED733_007774 [Metarhizium rileyi]
MRFKVCFAATATCFLLGSQTAQAGPVKRAYTLDPRDNDKTTAPISAPHSSGLAAPTSAPGVSSPQPSLESLLGSASPPDSSHTATASQPTHSFSTIPLSVVPISDSTTTTPGQGQTTHASQASTAVPTTATTPSGHDHTTVESTGRTAPTTPADTAPTTTTGSMFMGSVGTSPTTKASTSPETPTHTSLATVTGMPGSTANTTLRFGTGTSRFSNSTSVPTGVSLPGSAATARDSSVPKSPQTGIPSNSITSTPLTQTTFVPTLVTAEPTNTGIVTTPRPLPLNTTGPPPTKGNGTAIVRGSSPILSVTQFITSPVNEQTATVQSAPLNTVAVPPTTYQNGPTITSSGLPAGSGLPAPGNGQTSHNVPGMTTKGSSIGATTLTGTPLPLQPSATNAGSSSPTTNLPGFISSAATFPSSKPLLTTQPSPSAAQQEPQTTVKATKPPTASVTVTPTGQPDTNVPTAIPTFPTASTTVPSTIYASNLAQARNLNRLFSSLTPKSACTKNQAACITGQMAACNNGGFVLNACSQGQECYALPMTNTQGAKVGCFDSAYAQGILGSKSNTDVGGVPTTFKTEVTRLRLTRTQSVTVTKRPSTPTQVPASPSETGSPRTDKPELPAVKAPMASLPSMEAPAERRPLAETLTPPPAPPAQTAPIAPPETAATTKFGPPPPANPPSIQPTQVVITQSFDIPTGPPSPNATKLLLRPLDDGPATIARAPAVTANTMLKKDTGPSKTTIVNNGTPTVSVFFTVTVTDMQKETVTVTTRN